jgi:23S rRNA (uracil1939-C5)-methyltransferase
MSDSIDGTVENVAFGGEAVLHTTEGVVFVHDALPSEFISAKITSKKKNFSRGELLAVENPHPLRIRPRCPLFSVCGGCHLQHADYSLQVDFKQQWLRDSLRRIGGIRDIEVPPISKAQSIWAYRRHVTLHLEESNGFYRAIFHERNPNKKVSPQSCPIFSERDFSALHSLLEKVSFSGEGRVQIMKIEGERWIYTFHFRKEPKGAWEILRQLMTVDSACAGVKLKSAGKTRVVGETEGTIQVAGMTFSYSPDAFVQTHPDRSEAIYRKIVEHVRSTSKKRVLDLYGGIGVTACLVAKEGAQVTSVELSKGAVELARRNLKQLAGESICADVAAYLRNRDLSPFDLIIANPPREGIAPEPLKLLAASGKDILLISCMPTTLARDIKILVSSGYSLEWIEGYDMFPQTTHLETVAFMRRITS